MIVVYAPTKESFSTCVNLLPLKGVCPCFFSKDRMTSFSAKSDVLISAPSILKIISLGECHVISHSFMRYSVQYCFGTLINVNW